MRTDNGLHFSLSVMPIGRRFPIFSEHGQILPIASTQ